MIERRYQMTHVGQSDYVLPSNDGRTLWRIARYHEGGDLERDDGSRITGDFWGLWKYRRSLRLEYDAALDLTDWSEWEMWESLLRTRREAIDVALTIEERR